MCLVKVLLLILSSERGKRNVFSCAWKICLKGSFEEPVIRDC